MPPWSGSLAGNLSQWFLYCLVVSVFAAFIAGSALPPGAPPFGAVCRFAGDDGVPGLHPGAVADVDLVPAVVGDDAQVDIRRRDFRARHLRGIHLDVGALTTFPPVLCFHRIGGPLELGVTRVARSVFARQMTALARAGWRTLSLDQFAKSRTTHDERRTFLLSFDDGYASLAEHAYPVLADLAFTATTFLITDYVGKTNTWDVQYTWNRLKHLSWPEIEQWRARGFDFASHGASHRRLTWLEDVTIEAELTSSREALTARLGPEAGRAVAYPSGP